MKKQKLNDSSWFFMVMFVLFIGHTLLYLLKVDVGFGGVVFPFLILASGSVACMLLYFELRRANKVFSERQDLEEFEKNGGQY